MKNLDSIMQKYSDTFASNKNEFIGKDIVWAAKLREKAFEQFLHDGIPQQDVEEWNKVNYKNLLNNFFSISSKTDDKNLLKKLKAKDKNCLIRIIFLNGRMHKIESKKTFKGIKINSLKYFLENCPEDLEGQISDSSSFSEHRLSKKIDSRPQGIVALNAAFYQDGIVVLLEDNVKLSGFIEIIHLGNSNNASMSPVRSIISLGKNSSCQIIEKNLSSSNDKSLYFSNNVADINLSDFSSLTFLRMIEGNELDIHINTIHANLKNSANFYCPSFVSSCGQSRVESRVNLEEKDSSATINGLTIGKNNSTSESLTRVNHIGKYCSSNQTFRTILNENSQDSFQGKIRVEKGADQSNANMSSKSLLLSENAQANAKPELEILADEVKCTHGVTVGSFNPEQMFYICSRGLSEIEAKNLLTNAFLKVIIEELPTSLANSVNEFLEITVV